MQDWVRLRYDANSLASLAIKDNGKSMALNIRQKKYLRQQAHARKPVVTVGNQGLSTAVLAEIRTALRTHELLKIKLPAGEREARAVLLAQICRDTEAESVQLIGRVAIIYRPSDKPKIQLPA
jgi:RNA-binding protein